MVLLEVVILLLMLYALCITLFYKYKILDLHNFDVNCTIALKGVLAVLIVFHHASQNIEPIPVISQMTVWGPYLVAVFFFISGYGLSVSYIEKKDLSLTAFFRRRFRRILFLFILCVLLYQLFTILTVDKYNLFGCIVYNLPDFTDVILPTSWFIYVILLFYTLFYVIMKNTKSLRLGIIILFLLSLVIFYIFWLIKLGGWWRYSIFAFNVGMFFAYHENSFKSILLKRTNCVLSFALVLSCLLYTVFPFFAIHFLSEGMIFKIYSQLDCVLGPTIFPLFVVLILYITGITQNHVVMFLGKISLEIYLCQGAVCRIFSQLNLLHDYPAIFFVFILLTSVSLAYLLKCLEKIIMKA